MNILSTRNKIYGFEENEVEGYPAISSIGPGSSPGQGFWGPSTVVPTVLGPMIFSQAFLMFHTSSSRYIVVLTTPNLLMQLVGI